MRSFLTALLVIAAVAAAPMAAADPAAPRSVELSDDGLIWARHRYDVSTRRQTTTRDPASQAARDRVVTEFPIRRRASAATKSRAINSHKACVQNYPPLLAGADATRLEDWTIINRQKARDNGVSRPAILHVSKGSESWRTSRHLPLSGRLIAQRLAARLGGAGFPAGLGLTRIGDDLVLTDARTRPLLTPRHASRPGDCAFCADVQPLGAVCDRPAAARLVGDRGGQWAGAIRDKRRPLYRAPEGQSNLDILDSGQWGFRCLSPRRRAATPNPDALFRADRRRLRNDRR